MIELKTNTDVINALVSDLDAACQKHGVKLNAEVMGDGQGGKLVRAFAVMPLTFSLIREGDPDPLHDHDSNVAAETLHDGSGKAEPTDVKASAADGTQTPCVPKAEEDQPADVAAMVDAEPVELPKQKKKVDGIVNDGIEPTPKPLHEGFNPETDIDLKKFRRVINGLPGKTLREKMATASRYVEGELSVAQIQYYYYMRFDFKKGHNPLVLATMNQLFNMADARVIMDCMKNTGCGKSSVPHRIMGNASYMERMARQTEEEVAGFINDGSFDRYSAKVERADEVIELGDDG